MKAFNFTVAALGIFSIGSVGCIAPEDAEDPAESTIDTAVLGSTLTEQPLAARGGGGGSFNGHVTPPAVIYGIQVSSGIRVDRVRFFYYQPTRADNLYAGEETRQVTVGGTGGFENPAFICPANKGLIGLRGASGGVLDRLGVVCGDVTNPDPFSPFNTFSSIWGGGGGAFFDDRCSAGRLVDSFNLRSAAVIDNIQAICINAH